MNKKTIIAIISITIITVFAFFAIYKQGIINPKDNGDKETTADILEDTSVLSTVDSVSCKETSNDTTDCVVDEIIEKSEFHQVIRADSLYYCYFYNDNHEVVKKEGPLTKMPRITTVKNCLIKFTVQAGTGIGARWGYYYDTENIIFSEEFVGISDECEDKVACVGLNKVIVSNIFDSSKYYKEFSEFSYPFSQVATPITNIEFSSDGNSIIVSYLTGEDYQEVTEVFSL